MAIKVFGHRSPDTDATASAIIWAWYLTVQGKEAVPYVLGNLNNETKFVLDYWKVEVPMLLELVTYRDNVVIVDTNNKSELFSDINEAHIIQIIDHHKLVGGIHTRGPIDITIKPLASTASVMYSLMGKDAVENLPDPIAGLMLSCILSDSLEFRSPTTTDQDIEMAKHLSLKLNIDMKDYAEKMFAAKSDISSFSDEELIKMDSKKYDTEEQIYRVSVLETTSPEVVLERKESILKEMGEIKEKEQLDEVLLFVIDILKGEATLFVPNQNVKNIAEKSFKVKVVGDLVVLPGVVSRKKQIIPML